MLEDRLDDVGVVVHAELVRHGEEQRVGLGDAFVLLELLDQDVRLGGVAAAENGALRFAEHADLVALLAAAPEIAAVALVDQREDAARHRHPRRARMPGFFPRRAVEPDLLRLLDVERLAALIDLERRALQVHAELGRPLRGGVGAGAPPDALAQTLRVRLDAQEAGRVRKHRRRVGLGEALAAQHIEKDLGVAPRHVGVGHPLRRGVAEVAPAVDHLLGRAAADAELQAPAGDEVGRACVLRHVERVLVAHVDDRGADLDALGLGAARRQQRERRAELAGEMMHAEIGPVRAQLLGRDGELNRLQQGVGRRPRLRLRRRGPMAEREEADVFHGTEVLYAIRLNSRIR